jgi:hypothetical protein
MTFNICYHANVKKLKIDYGLVPAKFENGIWKSEVSNEIFEHLKKKKVGYIRFFKKKDQVYCQIIAENLDDDMLIAERKLLEISEKYIRSKIPFRFEYKKYLRKRIQRILHP